MYRAGYVVDCDTDWWAMVQIAQRTVCNWLRLVFNVFITTFFNYNSSESVIQYVSFILWLKFTVLSILKCFVSKAVTLGKWIRHMPLFFACGVCGRSYNSGPIYRMMTCLDFDIFILCNCNVGFGMWVCALARVYELELTFWNWFLLRSRKFWQ